MTDMPEGFCDRVHRSNLAYFNNLFQFAEICFVVSLGLGAGEAREARKEFKLCCKLKHASWRVGGEGAGCVRKNFHLCGLRRAGKGNRWGPKSSGRNKE